jgi:hypothetical protein
VYAVAGARSPVEKPTLEERTAPLLQAMPGAAGRPPVNPDELPISSSPLDTPPQSLPPEAGGAEPLPESGQANPGAAIPGAPSEPAASANQAYTPQQLEAMGLDLNGKQAPHRGVGARGPQVRGSAATVQRGAQLPEAFKPQDEFDPNIFNRRFFGN